MPRNFEVTFERVDTAEAMNAALEKHTWDIVLCDYSMPRFDPPSALSAMREKGLDMPFIIVSGTIGEEAAVEAMRTGVNDYILKGRLARFVPAVERELQEAALRVERRKMQEQLLIADRMVSIGTLAAGVAHEINNPLAAVMANLDLAAAGVAERAERLGVSSEFGEVRDELNDARESAERIRQIVRDLRIFSRSEEDGEKKKKKSASWSRRCGWRGTRSGTGHGW